MDREMRVQGHDSHADPIATFSKQMIPHHINAVNMAKLLLKFDAAAVSAVEDLEDILWGIINVQNNQVHEFRNYLGGHAANITVEWNDQDCAPSDGGDVSVPSTSATSGATGSVAGCVANDTNICVKVNPFTSETGYYEFA